MIKRGYYIRIYIRLLRAYINTRLQYRTDFILGFFGMIIRSLSGVLTLTIIFSNVPLLAGWSYYHLLFFYGLSVLAIIPAETFFSNIWNLHNHIIQGTFIKYRLKPLNVMFYYFSEIIEFKSMTQLFISMPLILYAGLKIGIVWNLNTVIVFLLYSVVSGVIVIEIYIMAASLGFWMTNSVSIINFIEQLIGFSRYPLNIYNRVLRILFTSILPIGFIAYYPMLQLLNEGKIYYLIVAMFIAFVMAKVCYTIWKCGVLHYIGTGS